MPWMMQKRENNAPQRLKELLERDEILKVPGAFNALVARSAVQQGFEALYISGAAFSASNALPDLGYFTVNELATFVRGMVRASNVPIIVDVDTGFGEVLHMVRTVVELEEAGAAAIQVEDQKLPKKCGHVEGKQLVSAEDMCRKIEAVKRVRKNLLIVARTDAHALHGLDEAIRRAQMYERAGADIIFPEALHTEEEFKKMSEAINVPLLANMTEFGKTPYLTAEKFQSYGYKIIIYPVTTLRVAMKAVEKVLKELKETGTQKAMVEDMQTRKELYELLDYYGYGDFDNEIAKVGFK